MPHRPPTILLAGGWSWHRHVGDDAILRAHLGELARTLPRHRPVVVCGEPERLAARLGVPVVWSAAPAIASLLDPALAPRRIGSAQLVPVVASVVDAAVAGRARELPELAALVDAIEAADAVVVAAAGSLTAAYPLTVAEQVAIMRIAQALGKPTVVSGASLGPFDRPEDAGLLGPALAASDLVALRDGTVSAARAHALGVPSERVAIQADPAFWMRPASEAAATAALERAGFDAGRDFGLLTVAQWPGGVDQVGPLAAVVDAVAEETGIAFCGVPMYLPPTSADDAAIDAIRGRLASPARLVRADPLPEDAELLAIAARARVVVGSRFHGAVFAAAAGTPSVLVHDGAYQRDKAVSLAASTASVQAVPLLDGPEAIARAAIDATSRSFAPVAPAGPLPALAWLAARLRRPSGRRGLRELVAGARRGLAERARERP